MLILKNIKLHTAVSIGLLIGLMIPTIISSWFTIINQRKILYEQLHYYHQHITAILAVEMQTPLRTNQSKSVSQLLNSIMRDQRILKIVIKTKDGHVFQEKSNRKSEQKSDQLVQAVMLQNHKLGEVMVEIDLQNMEDTIAAQKKKFWFATLLQFCFSLFLIFMALNSMLLKPLHRLIQQSKKLARRELKDNFVWKRNDEIGLIGQSLENTRKSLLNLFDELEMSNMRLNQRALELFKAKDAAEAANRTKSAFLANMSHELRTPLNHIIGFTDLVVSGQFGELNDSQYEFLTDVLSSSKHLLSLINDILDLSKVESGKLELKFNLVDITTLFEMSIVIVKERALKHAIILNSHLPEKTIPIKADERKLKQIMYNLISNAVKFTPDGGQVDLTAVLHNDFIQFSVSDTGIGLKEKDLESIFEPFHQVDTTTARRFEGTGLGLSLTKKLVDLHHGKIWAESEGEGQGCTFYFTLPLAPVF